mmetsp:Transcript_34469/g.84480  ORF Transcript_34469/g.84480 Transcript_34469/m.84480 type:complete len:197 (-) Transcript_34469:2338-2928(-)
MAQSVAAEALQRAGTVRSPTRARDLAETKLDRAVLLLDHPQAARAPVPENPRPRSSHKDRTAPDHSLNYPAALRLHELWAQYATTCLRLADSEPLDREWIAERITRMDLHGAMLQVIRSRDPTMVGKTGVVVRETANTFFIVSESSATICVPKQPSVFEFAVADIRLQLVGAAVAYRPSERSARRFKRRHFGSMTI